MRLFSFSLKHTLNRLTPSWPRVVQIPPLGSKGQGAAFAVFLLWFPLSVILLSAGLLTKHFSLSRSHVVQESFVTSCCLKELSRSGERPYAFGLRRSFIFYPLARFPLMIAFLRRFGLDISDPICSRPRPIMGICSCINLNSNCI